MYKSFFIKLSKELSFTFLSFVHSTGNIRNAGTDSLPLKCFCPLLAVFRYFKEIGTCYNSFWMCPSYVISFVGHPIVMVGKMPDIFSAITELVVL